MKRETLEAITALKETIDSLVGPGVHVFTDDSMTRAEKKMALFEGFLLEGHDIETAGGKAAEFLELAELAASPTNRPN